MPISPSTAQAYAQARADHEADQRAVSDAHAAAELSRQTLAALEAQVIAEGQA